jgi:menaquinone-dependent protoporphyrinogen oxidase
MILPNRSNVPAKLGESTKTPSEERKPIGVFYATREGHTARIAEHIASKLRSRGLHVRVHNVQKSSNSVRLKDYGAAILAASVHAGQHEREIAEFVRTHLIQLQDLPSAFLSVTLSEAGAERPDATPEEHARFTDDVEKVIDQFCKETQWRPKWIKPVAGALLYTKYNILTRFLMKRIAREAGAETDTSRDYVYTDWAVLDRFIETFVKETGIMSL